jgi:hypothetical protein
MRAHRLTLLPLAALWLMSAAATAATVYKWVDENGVTHYSDQPHPKAQALEVEGAQGYEGRTAPAASSSTASPATTSGPAAGYSLCELYKPEPEENFQNTSTITAKLRLEPTLLPGHRVVIALDGKRLTNQPPNVSEFVIPNVERGQHNVMVVVYDERGRSACTTSAVTFHVHQPSRQSPVRTSRPRF